MPCKRQSIRLKEYDYTQDGAYFFTVCAYERECLFGNVIDEGVWLTTLGEIVLSEWENTAKRREYVTLDAFVVMPNHVHGVILIEQGQSVGAWRAMPLQKPQFSQPISKSLSTIIGAFKSAATKSINLYRNTSGQKVWQRNFYERVIRSQNELDKIRQYIHLNPSNWHDDELNAKN